MVDIESRRRAEESLIARVDGEGRRRRESTERLVERAAHLPPPDRLLMEAVYRDGRSAREIAALLGARARSVSERVRRLAERLHSPEYGFVAARSGAWAPLRRRIAVGLVLHGRSERSVARELGVSLHTVRRHHEAVRMLLELSRALAKEVAA